MRSKVILIALASSLAACNTPDLADKGVAAVNVPVVTSADYVFDAAAPDGALAPGEADRLNGWFQSLGIGYGDAIYVDGGYADAARGQVAAIAGQYGMMVSAGAPVTIGVVQPGTVRVVVSRRRAEVPHCPNWSLPAQPNYDNRNMSNYGCGVNTNIAAMVANPEDLIHGREGAGTGDVRAAAKAVQFYRSQAPSGTKGLSDISTKKDN
ncbi:CpaD family pilus assembly lipoprotein [Sphingomonas segetis]|jgi:pilus assembly protein CpaD|uniref:CpaD family pilus assembly lipoprotein n=1 Tax=Sphingomonas segetis TaxID=1104779 RepID=UPI0012D2B67E|nr:CpaD family pilus assembly lipoprotein [Sphingomonas segetis]